MDAGLSLTIKFLVIALAGGAIFVGKKYFGHKDDYIVEEIIENEIERQIGIDVDLSPDSPESKE